MGWLHPMHTVLFIGMIPDTMHEPNSWESIPFSVSSFFQGLPPLLLLNCSQATVPPLLNALRQGRPASRHGDPIYPS